MHTIDHVAQISVDPVLAQNELGALQRLAVGMDDLAKVVGESEERVASMFPVGSARVAMFGGLPGLTASEDRLITSRFHWYSVSAYSYARLVGFLKLVASDDFPLAARYDPEKFKEIDRECSAYVASVPELEALVKWRHKVGAHFALTGPRSDDNRAALDGSIMPPIVFAEGRYRAAVWLVPVTSPGEKPQSPIPSWSLTEVHAALSRRYAPRPPTPPAR